MNDILNVTLRTLIVLVIIFFLFKLMGKKQVSQMSMFDYITGITIGSVVADISLDIEKKLFSGIVCLLIYCLGDWLISYISLKNIRLREFFNGKAKTLIENGKMNTLNMAKSKININILETEARTMGYFNLSDINNAILEPNGKISFELKEKEKPANKQDIGANIKDKGLVYNLIIDGKIIDENLKATNKTKKWINHELKIKGKKLDEILLMTIDSEENIKLFIK